jgi:energy-converting hydrogenase A subunit R
MTYRVFITDCEGPVSKNDNAFELAQHYIPNGAKFFRILSRYDDVLAYLERRPDYSAGYTLKLVAPFLKAYGATNQEVEEYSRSHILLIEDAKEALHYTLGLLPSYIVSTSYEQYIEALCKVLDFPVANTFSTKLDLDKHGLSEGEVALLKGLREEISQLPDIEIPEGAKRVEDLPAEMRRTVERLDGVFFSELPRMIIGRLLDDVRPIGSWEKAEALRKIGGRLKRSLDGFMYVGDSITDVEAFKVIREAGGLAVSFNGNQYAVREADVAILSKSALATALVAETFAKQGRDGVLQLAENWGPEAIRKSIRSELSDCFFSASREDIPRVIRVTSDNVEQLVEESNAFRKTVRGRAVGSLG